MRESIVRREVFTRWAGRLNCLVIVAFLASLFYPANGAARADYLSASQAEARYTQIVAGAIHTCGLTPDGAVQCWGGNWAGQLGDGSFYSFGVPVNVDGLSGGVAELAAGVNFTCALMDVGSVKCWGDNGYGQLGDGSTQNANVPVTVTGLNGVIAVGAGGDHACAVSSDGVKCWGRNDNGQLGNNSLVGSASPQAVLNLGGTVDQIQAGMSHTCALLENGGVQCWGNNEFGQLGDGTNNQSLQPVDVDGLAAGVLELSTRRDNTCALLSSGSVRCWGINWGGQLGNGSTDDSNVPVNVVGLSGTAEQVLAGGAFSCAVLSGGAVQCWGANGAGQLGNGSFADSLTPVTVSGLTSGVTALGGEFSHACASSADATVCWGANWSGELGDGVSMLFSAPRDVTGLSNNITTMAAGNGVACAVDEEQTLRCWGNNSSGQLGNGGYDQSSNPIGVAGLVGEVRGVSIFEATVCALTTSGGVKCWGLNDHGQVGDGTQTDAHTPADVTGLQAGVNSLTAGRFHYCAVLDDHTVRCWGNNQKGQLGNGVTVDSAVPVSVIGLGQVLAISAGSDHTCAVVGGSVYCWGGNSDGQLGNGGTTDALTPGLVSGLSGVTALASSLWNTCALTEAGAVFCWGAGFSGQLGHGTDGPSAIPTAGSGLTSGVTAIAGGYDHFCAVKKEGMLCWGANNGVQLGSGSTSDHENLPEPVTGLEANVNGMGLGSDMSCAIASGRAKCWGNNTSDGLGLGRDLYAPIPVVVLAERPRTLNLNYQSGAPGSAFTIRGSGFASGEGVQVSVVDQPDAESVERVIQLGGQAAIEMAVRANAFGEFVIFLDTSGAPEGAYKVEAAGSAGQASIPLSLRGDDPVRDQEGGGSMLAFFQHIFIPMMRR